MLKHPGRFIFCIVTGALVVFLLVNHFSQNDQTRIRRAVYAAVYGIEKADAARYGDILSSRYQDDSGYDKAKILSIAANAFKDFKPFKVEIKRLMIKPEGSQAETEIAYRCLFKKPGEDKIYYDAAKITASWDREQGGWKIVKMKYTNSQDMLFLPSVA